jgi:hypothetical protein
MCAGDGNGRGWCEASARRSTLECADWGLSIGWVGVVACRGKEGKPDEGAMMRKRRVGRLTVMRRRIDIDMQVRWGMQRDRQ